MNKARSRIQEVTVIKREGEKSKLIARHFLFGPVIKKKRKKYSLKIKN